MNENKKKDRYKTMMGLIMLASLLLGLIMGVGLGIQLSTLSSIKLGYWEGSVEATDIIVLGFINQIRGSDKVGTGIELGNTGGEAISCNCTLYYKSMGGEDLATYSFNATIDVGATHRGSFVVEPIDVSQWAGTDISIFEY
jgi:hypothetical protein